MVSQFVSIGRFAQLARLTPRALRLYDELGLLEPALVEPTNGYRLYRLEQLTRAHLIRQLRGLGLPLDDIRAYLRADSQAARRAMLEQHGARLERQLATVKDKLGALATLLQEAPMDYQVEVRRQPAQSVLVLREHVVLPETDGVLKRAMDEVYALLIRQGVEAAGAPWCAYPLPEEGEVVPVDCVVPIPRAVSGEGRITFEALPAIQVAHTRHTGPYADLPRAFEAVAAWIARHDLDIVGPLREVYVQHDPGPAQRHTVDVLFPVQPRSG